MLEQGRQIELLIVGNTLLPAAEEDADPFVSQRTNGGVVFLSAFNLKLVVRLSPGGPSPGVVRKFMKRLPNKLRTGHAPMDPMLLATLLGHRSDTGELLHFRSCGITIPIRAEGRR